MNAGDPPAGRPGQRCKKTTESEQVQGSFHQLLGLIAVLSQSFTAGDEPGFRSH